MDTETSSLAPYFRIEKVGKGYEFYCKKCKKAWGLPHEPNLGTILKLLDHGHSHLPPIEDEKTNDK